MRFSTQAVLAVALAQYAAAQTTHAVSVGEGALVFNPETVTAAIGDKVTFEFYPRNHSVVQSAFDAPCNPMSGGIYSGFVPSSSGGSSTIFTITISNTDPIWLYCSQGSHCTDGMAMVINPPSSGNTLAAYKSAASSARTASPSTGVSGGALGSADSSPSASASTASTASEASTMSTASEASTVSTASTASAMSTASTASTGSTASTATASAMTTMSGTVSGSVVATATKAIATAAAGKVAGGMGVAGGVAALVLGLLV